MTDLQIALIFLGIIIVLAVVVYNWRQEKNLRSKISNDFIVPHKDVLVDTTSAHEIDQTALQQPSNVADIEASDGVETVLEKPAIDENKNEKAIEENEQEVAVADEKQETPELIEEAIIENELTTSNDLITLPKEVHVAVDLIALLTATEPMNGQQLLARQQAILPNIGALIMLYGADEANNWHRIDEALGQHIHFRKVICSLQLADRRGPVGESVIHQFQFAINAIGVEFDAHVVWQGEHDPVKQAIDLDDFCMHVDQLVRVHLMQGKTPIHGTKFKGLAEANDMQLVNGQFYCYDEKNKDQVIYTLINADDQPFTAESLRLNIVRGATFQIEVPKLENCEQTFNRVILVAQQMAGSVGAALVDDNQRPLGTAQVEKIRQQLKVIHSAMVERKITPGSSISQRLFS
jgi:FtsZ-interacting cell division protein ZipA